MFIWSEDTVTGEKEYVGSFGIISGALAIDQLVFTTSEDFKTFSGLSSHDDTFYSEMTIAMDTFMRFSIPLAPRLVGSEFQYNFIF